MSLLGLNKEQHEILVNQTSLDVLLILQNKGNFDFFVRRMRIRIIPLIHRVPTTKLSAKRIILRRTGRIFASFFYYKPGNSDCVLYSLKMNGFAVHAVFPETEQRKIMIAHISRIWIFSSLLFFRGGCCQMRPNADRLLF